MIYVIPTAGIHRARPHTGQMLVAARLRSLLHSDVHPSEIVANRKGFERIQDAYSLRCIPQVSLTVTRCAFDRPMFYLIISKYA